MTKPSGTVRLVLWLSLAGGLAAADGCVTYRARDDAGDASPPAILPVGEDPGPAPVDFDGGCAPQATPPDFGAPVTCGTPPPPISGGTLIVSRDGTKAIAADSDRDQIYVIDLASKAREFTIVLHHGDEPGRLAEDGAGRVHVALRGSGMLATIDPAAGTVTDRRAVCPAPRGVAWQASSDVVWVACETGELASLPAAGGAATVKVVGRDLRDVVVNGDEVAVTRFRSAELLRLAADGTVSRTDPMTTSDGVSASHVAWRAVPGPGGTVVAVHQGESTLSVSTKSSGGYGCGGSGGPSIGVAAPSPFEDGGPGSDNPAVSFPPPGPPGLGGPVTSVLNVLAGDGTVTVTLPFNGVLPVDVAVSSDGTTIASVAAGAGTGTATIANLFLFETTAGGGIQGSSASIVGPGQATAVAFESDGELLVQTREPAALWVMSAPAGSLIPVGDGGPQSIALSPVSVRDTGHDIFHTHAGALIACASCHPEGGDDGHVWRLDGNQRRTPSLRGTIAGTAPYHWPGDEADFTSIVKDVYEGRMSGTALSTEQTAALSTWVNGIPAPPAPTWVDAGAAAAGRAIFQRVDVGCSGCHSGAKFTNNATVDVGTGGAFQVPPLVGVGWRTPLMHDGCATTLADRFGACSTAQHGHIASLSATDVTNLTAYLETL